MLPEADDEENDMLDLAFGLEDTYVRSLTKLLFLGLRKSDLNICFIYRSRLGCQVKLTKELDGMVATLPSATRNMYVDGKSSLLICDLIGQVNNRNRCQGSYPLSDCIRFSLSTMHSAGCFRTFELSKYSIVLSILSAFKSPPAHAPRLNPQSQSAVLFNSGA